MERIECKSIKEKKPNIWKYIFIEVGTYSHIYVCKTFICNVLKIGFSRIIEIQVKIINKKSLADMREKHNNRANKLNENFPKVFEKFLNNFP
jgi:hypothetical protein